MTGQRNSQRDILNIKNIRHSFFLPLQFRRTSKSSGRGSHIIIFLDSNCQCQHQKLPEQKRWAWNAFPTYLRVAALPLLCSSAPCALLTVCIRSLSKQFHFYKEAASSCLYIEKYIGKDQNHWRQRPPALSAFLQVVQLPLHRNTTTNKLEQEIN